MIRGAEAPEREVMRVSPLEVRDVGRMSYPDAWALQKELVGRRTRGEIEDLVLVCEHEPVVTTGRGTGSDFLLDERFAVYEVERGGEATYHGPGQVVAYPIVRLADGRHDLRGWLRALEQAVIETLATFELPATRRDGATGVWTADCQRKLASLGVAASRWVTYHGLALNHETELEHFAAIRPCGFDAAVMTSMRAELGAGCPTREAVVDALSTRLDALLHPFRADS